MSQEAAEWMTSSTEPITIGVIVKTHGIRGAVLVRSQSDVEGRYDELSGALLVDRDGGSTLVEIESVEAFDPDYLIKFRGIDDPESARDRLVGRALAVDSAAVPPAGESANYHFELLGLQVVCDGRTIGVLESILETGANDVYVVRVPEGGEVLIPATREAIAEVDIAAGRMTVRAMAGLFDGGDGSDRRAGSK